MDTWAAVPFAFGLSIAIILLLVFGAWGVARGAGVAQKLMVPAEYRVFRHTSMKPRAVKQGHYWQSLGLFPGAVILFRALSDWFPDSHRPRDAFVGALCVPESVFPLAESLSYVAPGVAVLLWV